MKRLIGGFLLVGFVMALWAGSALSNSRTEDPLGIAVSPQTLILGADQGGDVKVHTAIPLSVVDRSSVTLNGLETIGIGVDSLGHIVAIFSESAVKELAHPPSIVLTLEGLYLDGSAFSGSDVAQVIVEPCPKK